MFLSMDSYFCLYKMLIFFCKMQTSRGEKHLKNKIDRRKKMRKKSTKLLALLTAGITAASIIAGCGSGRYDNAGTNDQKVRQRQRIPLPLTAGHPRTLLTRRKIPQRTLPQRLFRILWQRAENSPTGCSLTPMYLLIIPI